VRNTQRQVRLRGHKGSHVRRRREDDQASVVRYTDPRHNTFLSVNSFRFRQSCERPALARGLRRNVETTTTYAVLRWHGREQPPIVPQQGDPPVARALP
jgi:hypothetical protein